MKMEKDAIDVLAQCWLLFNRSLSQHLSAANFFVIPSDSCDISCLISSALIKNARAEARWAASSNADSQPGLEKMGCTWHCSPG